MSSKPEEQKNNNALTLFDEMCKPKNKKDFEELYDMKNLQNIKATEQKQVFKTENKETKQVDVLKFIKIDEKFDVKMIKEIQIIISVDHTNIVEYYDMFFFHDEEEKPQYIMAMEYCDNNLENEITNRKKVNKQYTDIELVWMLKQSLEFLQFLFNESKTHIFGIQPSNIFIGKNNVIKFSDFGISKAMQSQTKTSDTLAIFGEVGSHYAAPEYMDAIRQGKVEETLNPKKCDIFSLGFVLLRCSALLKHEEMEGLNHKLNQQKIATLIKGKVGCRGKYFAELFTSMTMIDKDQRADWDKIKELINCGKVCEGLEKKEKK